MPAKCSKFGSTLRLTPWKLTQWRSANADAGDLRLADKDPDLPLAALAFDTEARERGDEPVLQRVHEGAHVAAARR